MTGAVLLSETNRPLLDLNCQGCGRHRLDILVERFGPEAHLPEVAPALEDNCGQKRYDGAFVTVPGLEVQA